MKRIRPRLTYANVTATIALLLALGGGGAYAASKLKKNSVTSAAIRNGQVKTKDLAKNAVVSSKIKDGQVGSGDIADGGVGAADVAPAEGFHLVGQPNEPGFGNGGQNDCIWSNYSQSGIPPDALNPVAFFKDPYGVVHLVGVAGENNGPGGDMTCGTDGDDGVIFTLPPDYRPAHVELLGTAGTNAVIVGSTTNQNLNSIPVPAGAVIEPSPSNGGISALDGATFRAAGPGNNLRKAAAGSGAGGSAAALKRLLK
jgi:hypothetical protein